MKLIIFLDKDKPASEDEMKILSKLSKGNLYYELSQQEKDLIGEQEESFLSGILVDTITTSKKHKPIVFNYYKVTSTPTIIFTNEDEVVYRWDKVPNLSEIVKSMVSYFKILKLSELDYDYDPEE